VTAEQRAKIDTFLDRFGALRRERTIPSHDA
jgi:hypothetical protein